LKLISKRGEMKNTEEKEQVHDLVCTHPHRTRTLAHNANTMPMTESRGAERA
jgi:hypothetical protein